VRGVERVEAGAGDEVVVLGGGVQGTLIAGLLAGRGCLVTLCDPHAPRRERALRFGASRAMDAPRDPSAVQAVKDAHGGGRGPAAVVEAVGRPEAWEAAVAIARPGGEVLLYGGCAAGTTVTLPTFPLHYGELAIRGSYHHTPEAVREALINAVVHTDYSQRGAPIRLSIFDDRLEIENPGLLPFGLTVEDLPHGVSRLRNRVIGRVFQALGLIEQWGSGIQRMTAVCQHAGLPPPSFEEIATRFRVTIPTVPVGPTVVDATEQAILTCLKGGQGLATREIATIIGLSARATRTRLARLIDRGLVREIGTSAQDPQRKYFLAEGGPP